jgi:hypothetical protein
MKRSLIAAAVALVVVAAAAMILLNRPAAPPVTTTTTLPPPAALKGVAVSPRSYTGGDFAAFFTKAKQAGGVVTWSGDWAELSGPNGGPYVVAELAASNDLEIVAIAQFFTQSTGELLKPLNNSVKQAYVAGAVAFADKYEPAYMGFGIEVNALHELSPTDYDAFKAFFPEVATAVRAASPETRVFTVFQLERLRGLRGGLFGSENDPTGNDWALLGDFPEADLLAFTTYPCIIYKDPADVPADYYSELILHTSKPLIFTEAGWFRTGFEGWESSPEEQARFVALYKTKTEPLEPELLIWSFLYDQDAPQPFTTMGLLRKDDSNSLAWEAWLKP